MHHKSNPLRTHDVDNGSFLNQDLWQPASSFFFVSQSPSNKNHLTVRVWEKQLYNLRSAAATPPSYVVDNAMPSVTGNWHSKKHRHPELSMQVRLDQFFSREFGVHSYFGFARRRFQDVVEHGSPKLRCY